MDFFINNWIWFLLGAIVFGFIGFLADKNGRGLRKKKDQEIPQDQPDSKPMSKSTSKKAKPLQETAQTPMPEVEQPMESSEEISSELFAPLESVPTSSVENNSVVEDSEVQSSIPEIPEEPVLVVPEVQKEIKETEDTDIWNF